MKNRIRTGIQIRSGQMIRASAASVIREAGETIVRKYGLLAAAILLGSTGLSAKEPVPPPEPAEHPDWSQAARDGLKYLTRGYRDPESIQINWSSGFQWGYIKPAIGRRSFAWVACGTINAKNGFGGYVGEQSFFLSVEPGGDAYASQTGVMRTTCDESPIAPVNDELLVAVGRSPRPQPSLADEIGKLMDLREAGVLTDAEFELAKAKLLAK